MSPWSSAPHWRSVAPDAIAWREWDGELVVRNECSGSSHLLGPLAGKILQILLESDEALSVAAIATKLPDRPDGGGASAWNGAIDEVLAEFQRLGLAHPEAP